MAAAFALQPEHLNVSLPSIGLQWTISDFVISFSANEPPPPPEIASPPSPAPPPAPSPALEQTDGTEEEASAGCSAVAGSW